jgi:hypothetical protein
MMMPQAYPSANNDMGTPNIGTTMEGGITPSTIEPLLLNSRSVTQVVTPEIATMLKELPPADALKLFEKDPVSFMLDLMNAYFVLHTAVFQQSAEFQAALMALRQHDPAFVYYQQAILQEARAMVAQQGNPTDPEGDGLVDNWITLLLKAKATVEANLQQGNADVTNIVNTVSPQPTSGIALEGSQKTKPKEGKKTFTRQQIAKMSREDYLQHETAIKQALKEGRIQ